MKGAGKEGLTIAGRELAFHYVDDYAHSLANSFLQLSNLMLQFLYLLNQIS